MLTAECFAKSKDGTSKFWLCLNRQAACLGILWLVAGYLSAQPPVKKSADLNALELYLAKNAPTTEQLQTFKDEVAKLKGFGSFSYSFLTDFETNQSRHNFTMMRGQDEDLQRFPFVPFYFELNIHCEAISDAGLKALKSQKNLRRLWLTTTQVTDEGLKYLRDLENLTEVSLRQTRITDEGLKELATLDKLECLDLRDTSISDAGVNELKCFKQLSLIRLSDTRVTEVGIKELVESLPHCKVTYKHPVQTTLYSRTAFKMETVKVQAGKFVMGSSKNDLERIQQKFDSKRVDETEHEVELSSFHIGKYPVTRGHFRVFVAQTNYKTDAEKDGKGGEGFDPIERKIKDRDSRYSWRFCGVEQTDEHPVVNVSWNDANAFCDWLSRKMKRTVSLPTEAQFEFACRAGTTTMYFTGDDSISLKGFANVCDLSFCARKRLSQSVLSSMTASRLQVLWQSLSRMLGDCMT